MTVNAFFGSMRGRVFLVLVGGVVASVFLTAGLADREGRHGFHQAREAHMAERVRQLVVTLEAAPPDMRRQLLAATGRGMSAHIGWPEKTTGEQSPGLTAALVEHLGPDRDVVATRGGASDCAALPADTEPAGAESCELVLLRLHDGTPLRLVLRSVSDSPWAVARPRLLLYVLLFPLCLVLLAYVVARMATAPLGDFARAASELGRNINRTPLPELGPTEVRSTAAALNAMQGRIRKHLQERTHILAAIAHDLQTPLTRLRLRLEKVTDEGLREKLVGDLEVMQTMIRDGLDFARSADASATTQRVDLDSLLATVCADAVDAGQDVTPSGRVGVSIAANPAALQRALANLIDNAVKYGGFARLTVSRDGAHVVIRIRDGGPGIPDAQLEAVFDPFYRLEGSRSRDTGGTGLGLTIARNVARQCGGTLALHNAPTGGLEAVLTLPVNAQ